MDEPTTPTTPTTPPAAPIITPEKKAFLAAFAKAQGAYLPIIKNAHVMIRPRDSAAYEFDYADLGEILDKTRQALSANGLSTRVLLTGNDGDNVWLNSIVAHADGYEDVSSMQINAGGDIKQFGGRITYIRRYLLGPQLGVAGEGDAEDDGRDGREGEGFGDVARGAKVETRPKPTPARKAPPPAPAPTQTRSAPDQGMPPEPPPEGTLPEKPAPKAPAPSPMVSPIPPSDAPAAADGDDGELASTGEVKYILGRLTRRSPAEAHESIIRAALDAAGCPNHPTSEAELLKRLTKTQFALLTKQLT